jgi:hypothetical protein
VPSVWRRHPADARMRRRPAPGTNSITALSVIDTLQQFVQERGAPPFIRSDNDPEFNAKAAKTWMAERGMKPLYIEPGSPGENALQRELR